MVLLLHHPQPQVTPTQRSEWAPCNLPNHSSSQEAPVQSPPALSNRNRNRNNSLANQPTLGHSANSI